MDYVLIKQDWWGLFIAGYLFLGGMGGMMFVAAAYWWLKQRNKVVAFFGGISALLMMITGIGLLVLDLTRPLSAVLVYTSPRLNLGSWIAIGTYIITVYTLLLALFVAQFFPGLRRLPWHRLKGVLDRVSVIALVFGVLTATYTGFLLSSAPGVVFWDTLLLPALFVTSGLSTGLCFYCLLLGPITYLMGEEYVRGGGRIRVWMQRIDVVSLAIEAILIFALIGNAYISGHPAAIESARTLLYGELSPLFWGLVVLAGIVIPLLVMLLYTTRTEEETAPIVIASSVIALLVLVGGFTLRYIVLEAGYVMVPVG